MDLHWQRVFLNYRNMKKNNKCFSFIFRFFFGIVSWRLIPAHVLAEVTSATSSTNGNSIWPISIRQLWKICPRIPFHSFFVASPWNEQIYSEVMMLKFVWTCTRFSTSYGSVCVSACAASWNGCSLIVVISWSCKTGSILLCLRMELAFRAFFVVFVLLTCYVGVYCCCASMYVCVRINFRMISHSSFRWNSFCTSLLITQTHY